MRRLGLVMAIAMLLPACGDQPADPPPADGQAPTEPGEVEGVLGGNAELEGGCAWLDTDDGRFEVIWPDGYQVELDPVRLLGPDGEVLAEQGDTVRVSGEPADDMVSVCQVGTLYRAEHVDVP